MPRSLHPVRFALLALALVAIALTAAPAGAAQNAPVPQLDWKDCDDGFECATAKVPLDHSRPRGRTIDLALVRFPAVDREHRIGSLFIHPGGSGGAGVHFVRGAPPQALALIGRRFGTNDAEALDLSAQGRRLRLSRDVENVVIDLDDMEEINPVVNGGADTIAVGDLSATGVDEVNVNLEPGLGTPGGDGAPDRVIATGTDGDDAVTVAGANGTVAVTGLAARLGITHAEGIDSLAIDTRAGRDAVDATGLAADTIQLTTD
jgi:hypothetical protein